MKCLGLHQPESVAVYSQAHDTGHDELEKEDEEEQEEVERTVVPESVIDMTKGRGKREEGRGKRYVGQREAFRDSADGRGRRGDD